MSKVAIISDDTCDLPVEILDEFDITLVPTKVIFSDKVFQSCGVRGDLSLDEYYQRAQEELPSTSQPSPGAIKCCLDKAFESADELIGIFISEHMSPIAKSCQRIAKQFYPDKNISIYDSGVTSVGLGILVLEAARMAKAGHSKEEIEANITLWLDQVHYAGIMFTLENLVRTGRVPRTKKFMADFFKVKPIVKFVDGKVTVQGKIRAKEELIIQQMKKFGRKALEHMNGESDYVFIGHTRWPEAAAEVADYLAQYNTHNKQLIIQETGAIVANYVGRKTMTLGYLGKYDENWLKETETS